MINEADRITSCLNSAKFADQLLIIDFDSTDSITNITRSLGPGIHHRQDWQGYSTQIDHTLGYCHCEHIFFDCDKIVPAGLAEKNPWSSGAVEQCMINRCPIYWDDYVLGRHLEGIQQTQGIARLFKVSDLAGFEGQAHEGTILQLLQGRSCLHTSDSSPSQITSPKPSKT